MKIKISSSIEGLIGNKDLAEGTNRRYTAGYIMEQLAIWVYER